jgi:hypothetical protein
MHGFWPSDLEHLTVSHSFESGLAAWFVIDQMPNYIAGFSWPTRQPKTSLGPPRLSSINQILLAFLFP